MDNVFIDASNTILQKSATVPPKTSKVNEAVMLFDNDKFN
jgi:hypothetical protein